MPENVSVPESVTAGTKTAELFQETEEPKPMELQVISNVHKFQWNFEEIKTAVQAYMDKYVGLVVTEDNLKDMESAQKEIAGVRTKIDKFRKEVKKLLNEPYENFEGQVKELQELINQAETPLKEQILKYEDERVATKEKELMEFAKKTAANLGLRNEYFKISIQSKWTNRTAKDSAVRKEIVTLIEGLLDQQSKDDEAKELQRQKTELIVQLCASTSKTFLLKTPVVPQDVELQVHNAALADIPGIITEVCRKRADMERKAAEPQQPEFTPQPHMDSAPPMPPVQQEYAPAPYPPTPPNLPPCPPPINTRTELWDVDLHISGITVAKAENLKAYMTQSGIQYKFSGYVRRS